jgi:hypothetical protein
MSAILPGQYRAFAMPEGSARAAFEKALAIDPHLSGAPMVNSALTIFH